LLAGLPQLPYARRELDAARTLLGAGAQDQLLGPAFTVPAVEKAPLKAFRVLHFAAHALLPSELKCQSEPAIVTSDPVGASDATKALLTASEREMRSTPVQLQLCVTKDRARGFFERHGYRRRSG